MKIIVVLFWLLAQQAAAQWIVIADSTSFSSNLHAARFQVAAGTAAAPSIRGSADTNTGLAWLGNDTLAVVTGGTEKMRWTPSSTTADTVFVKNLRVRDGAVGDTIKFNVQNTTVGSSGTPNYMSINFLGWSNRRQAAITVIEQNSSSRASKIDFAVNSGTSESLTNYIRLTHLGHWQTITNKTQNLGSAAASWDTTWTKVQELTADMPFFDDRDDVALIRGIKGSGLYNRSTGYEIVDDWTLPAEIMVLHREDRSDTTIVYDTQVIEEEQTRWDDIVQREVTELVSREVKVPVDTLVTHYKTGDWIVDSDGKPYFDVTAAIGLGYGAIRQLSREVDDLEAAVYDPELGGVPLVTYVLGLAALVAALSAYVATLKKQVNDLEARIANLEGVAPNPPNPEEESKT